jgi:hypothetical protein
MKKTDEIKNKLFPQKRIPLKYLKKLEKIGGGEWRRGLEKVINIFDIVERDPSIVLQKEFDFYTSLIKAVSSENHYEHFVDSGIPAVHFNFHKTGYVNSKYLKKRQEKPIDDFDKKGDDKK